MDAKLPSFSPENIWSYCVSCCKQTNHTIDTMHKVTWDSDYCAGASEYMVITCKGCENTSFLSKNYDYETPVQDDNGNWEPDVTVNEYPKYIYGHTSINHFFYVPDTVGKIYDETISAYKEGASLLAGLGLRATIEAVCNNKDIRGSNLSIKINNLVKEGFISKNDAMRLHAIRFLGNDAAHDIIKPDKSALSVALKIVEHLITTVYILEAEADNTLETAVENYESFIKLLNIKLKDCASGEERPLAKILGKSSRRLIDNFQTMEQKLIGEINTGAYSGLELGSKQQLENTGKVIQFFLIRQT